MGFFKLISKAVELDMFGVSIFAREILVGLFREYEKVQFERWGIYTPIIIHLCILPSQIRRRGW